MYEIPAILSNRHRTYYKHDAVLLGFREEFLNYCCCIKSLVPNLAIAVDRDFAKEAKSPLPYSYFAIDSLDGIWVGSEASIERAIVQTGCRILAVCHNGSLEEGLEHYAGLLPRALLPSRSPIILTFTHACVWPPSKLTMHHKWLRRTRRRELSMLELGLGYKK
ncbi:hypothetical protein VNO77_27162 [Canavalia gladiata]|uniref:Uncharacterized protein n=1 Tax=Canavalia gladiata TaxID=3824 RepID=A0AAN9KWF9_CANGL